MFFVTVLPAIIISQIEPTFIMGRQTFIRESSSKMYSQIVFALSQLGAESPYSLLCAVAFFLLLYYPMVRFFGSAVVDSGSPPSFRRASTNRRIAPATSSSSSWSPSSSPSRWDKQSPLFRLRSTSPPFRIPCKCCCFLDRATIRFEFDSAPPLLVLALKKRANPVPHSNSLLVIVR